MRPFPWFRTLITVIAFALAGPSRAGEWVPGELIVKFRADVPTAEKSALVKGRLLERLDFTGAELWTIKDDVAIPSAAAALAADARVE